MNKVVIKETDQKFQDGLENLVTGLGTEKDRTTYNRWAHEGRNADHVQLSARFREDWLSQKVCTIVPQDITREWRKINTVEGKQADKQLRIASIFREAYKWARCYGTSFIVLDLKGAGDVSKPLDPRKLRAGCIKSLQVVDRTRIVATGLIDTEPMSPTYGLPTHYQFIGSPKNIHHSRLIRFEGTELPLFERMRNQWYSDSVLIPLMDTIDNFHMAAASAAQLCQESNVDVVSIEGLQNLLTNPEGEVAVMKRFRLMKQMKSIYNVLLLDSTETYDTKSIALNGVKDLIWEYLRVVAAAVGIPATRFLSASPDGMNATGESDLINYIDLLQGIQTDVFEPRLEKLDLVIQKHFGIGEYEYEWNCIFPESATQKSERVAKEVEALSTLVTAGILAPQAALNILKERDTFHGVDLGSPPPPPKEKKGSE